MVPFAPLLLLACQADLPLEVELTLADRVSTVVMARWETPEETLGRVIWTGPDGQQRALTEDGEPRTEHVLPIAGLAPNRAYDFRVEAEGDLDRWQSEEQTVHTGPLPSSLARFQVSGAPDAFEGFLPLVLLGESPGLVVVDAAGAVVWYHQFSDESWAPLRAWYVPGQRRFLVNDGDSERAGRFLWVGLDGEEGSGFTIEGHHHDFVVQPDGALLAIVEDVRTVDGRRVVGDGLVRAWPGKPQTQVWSAWDSLDPAETGLPDGGDWTHANAVDYLPDRDLVLVGLRHLDTILALDGTTFELQWAVGGDVGTLDIDDDARFQRQHQFELSDDDHLLVFDNHAGVDGAEPSRVVELALDLDAGTATETWRLEHDPPLHLDVLGNAQYLPEAGRLLTWSFAGEIQLVDDDGSVTWQLNTSLGSAIAYGDWFRRF